MRPNRVNVPINIFVFSYMHDFSLILPNSLCFSISIFFSVVISNSIKLLVVKDSRLHLSLPPSHSNTIRMPPKQAIFLFAYVKNYFLIHIGFSQLTYKPFGFGFAGIHPLNNIKFIIDLLTKSGVGF